MVFDPAMKLTRENFRDLPLLASDGAWGTELMKRGGTPGEVKDLWNVSALGKVLEVARSYVEAGAQVILTNTFSSNRIVLAAHGAAGRAAEITRAGAEISRRAAGSSAYVFGSIGPTGKLVSMGDLDPAEAEEVFAEQAEALEAGGADAIVVETQSDLEEARAALKACLRATSLPVGVSFTFDSGKDGTRTMMGVTVEKAHEMARSCGASFVGANCGLGIESSIPVARLFASRGGDLPIWIKGNAGRPEVLPDGQTAYRATPEVFIQAVRPLVDAGARFIGGCCGSTPVHIRALVGSMAEAGR